MKNIVIVALFGVLLQAGQLQFEHDYKKALEKAKAENKEVMMMYSATWCPECSYMKDVVFKDSKISKYIKNHFVLLSLDIDKSKLPKGFDYVGIPTFFFLNNNEKKLGKITGGAKANIFLERLKSIK